MKSHIKSVYRISILVACLVVSTFNVGAYTYVQDGIYYFFAGDMAVVTHGDDFNSYHGHVTIPSSVTYNGTTYPVAAIGSQAFEGCVDLTTIDIPSTVTAIGQSAFYNCSSLRSITLPNSVTQIDSYAFSYCGALTTIN